MKPVQIKNSILAGFMMGTVFYVANSFAHEVSAFLGKSANATDFYQVQCFDNGLGATDTIVVKVSDQNPVKTPMLSVQVSKDNMVRNTTDPIDGDEVFSPAAKLKGGNGVYLLTVDKTAEGEEAYNLEVHCLTAAGDHTGTTDPEALQDR